MTHLYRNLLLAGVWQAVLLVFIFWKKLGISPEFMIKVVDVGFYVMLAGASAFMWWAAVVGPNHHLGH